MTPVAPGGRGDPGRTTVFEMLGLMRGVLADGVVNEAEARAVGRWLREHPGAERRWPARAVARRIRRILEDGVVDEDERAELADLFQGLLNEHEEAGGDPSVFPNPDDPPPVLQFRDHEYVFVGRFAYGPLGDCHRAVVRLGGRVDAAVTDRTDYVVVGEFGGGGAAAPGWRDKLERARSLREEGGKVAIVAESHWAAGLP